MAGKPLPQVAEGRERRRELQELLGRIPDARDLAECVLSYRHEVADLSAQLTTAEKRWDVLRSQRDELARQIEYLADLASDPEHKSDFTLQAAVGATRDLLSEQKKPA